MNHLDRIVCYMMVLEYYRDVKRGHPGHVMAYEILGDDAFLRAVKNYYIDPNPFHWKMEKVIQLFGSVEKTVENWCIQRSWMNAIAPGSWPQVEDILPVWEYLHVLTGQDAPCYQDAYGHHACSTTPTCRG